MTQQETHAAAMEQTAAFYDHIVSTPTRNTPLYGLNSLAPFWAIEGSITGGMWGPSTEFTEHACAVTDAYEFKPRYETRKYPALESDDCGMLDSEYEFYETKSLVFRREDGNCADADLQFQDEPVPGSYPSEVRQGISKPDDKDPDETQRRVTDAELNAEYAKYVEGTGTEESVMSSLVAFARGKLSYGSKEYSLRPVEQDQLLSKFMEKMDRAIREGMYSGEDGKPFCNYVKSAWANMRADAYRRQKRVEDRFESSTFDFPVDENGFQTSTEDAAAFITYRDSRPDQDRETALLIHELRSRLSKSDRAIFEALRDNNQMETADRLGISRHSVARAEKRIEKAGRKALVRLSLSKVVA